MADQLSPGPPSVAGSTLRPIYSRRDMKCYAVTESELRTLGIVNTAITALFGLGSACITFGVDVFKDTLLATSIPDSAKMVVQMTEPASLALGIVFWVL